jgi:hypothetical protein
VDALAVLVVVVVAALHLPLVVGVVVVVAQVNQSSKPLLVCQQEIVCLSPLVLVVLPVQAAQQVVRMARQELLEVILF